MCCLAGYGFKDVNEQEPLVTMLIERLKEFLTYECGYMH